MGKMEIGESPTACAVRETLEETGIEVELTGLLGIFSDPTHIVAYTDGEVRQEYEVTFLARPIAGDPTSNDEASEVGWFRIDQIDDLDIHGTMRRQIAHYVNDTMPHFD